MVTKESAIQKVSTLVERFHEQIHSYKHSSYNETQTRRDFIDPFFKALGWDMDNEQGYAESYREVMHEDKVKIEDRAKSPDYSFRYGGQRLFFVEAKKPSIYIKDDILPAYQLRRYGWNAKLPISIVTDFEEFALYDCTRKPLPNDKASTARLKYIKYDEYMDNFDFIWDTFSRDKVLKGGLDKYVKNDSNKKGTSTVDHEFLQSLDRWRGYLATSISKKNKHLNEDHINYAVQQTIDRIIFLRIAEDRSVEPYGTLKDCIKKNNFYQNLFGIFAKADQKYNSGLFDLRKDRISKDLEIEDKVVKTIVNELYYPECPYEFAYLPVEILGTAYERFLGKQIKVDKSHRVKIEEKPEVRKAGGVYYTPQYIVDYIVKNTVGKLIEERTKGLSFNKSIEEVSKIRIVDPACGSGSFLLGAYQFLLNWHLDTYHKVQLNSDGKRKGQKSSPLTPEGNLTTDIKKKILVNNIYGVDLDANAVEVTKLSLLIKCMEGETQASIANNALLFHEAVLPTLDDNIKNGNSLIDVDFYDNQLDFGDERKIKPFSWRQNFPTVFKQGGFDIVIGNPPYVLVFDKEIKHYLETSYSEFQRNNDLYVAFISKSLKILRTGGKFSMIVPNTFIKGDYFVKLRDTLRKYKINEIVDFGNKLIFDSANVFTGILNISNQLPAGSICLKSDLVSETLMIDPNSEVFVYKNKLIEKLDKYKKFGDFFLVKDVGYNYWSIGRGKTRGDSIGSRILYKGKKENQKDIPYLKGANFHRYKIQNPEQYLRHNYTDYLDKNDVFRFSESMLQESPKLIYRQTSASLVGMIDTQKYHVDKTVHIILPKEPKNIDLKFVLGLFNSKLLNFYYSNTVNEAGRTFAQVKTIYIKQLPFILPSNKIQKEVADIVDVLLDLNIQLGSNENANKKDLIIQRIRHMEDKINKIIYRIFQISDKEISTVENS